MIRTMPTVAVTLRLLVDRRRSRLMVLLAATPVLIVLAAVIFGDTAPNAERFDELIVRIVLPLIALVFGTGALGTELDDGTIVYLLTKPMRRARIVLAKGSVATALTALLIVAAAVLTGLIASIKDPDLLGAGVAFAVAGAAGAAAYSLGFLALSAFTSRALYAGLGYILIWEGIVAGLFPATQVLSVRQATVGLAAGLLDADWHDGLDLTTSIVVLSVVIAGALLLASWRLSRYQLSGGD